MKIVGVTRLTEVELSIVIVSIIICVITHGLGLKYRNTRIIKFIPSICMLILTGISYYLLHTMQGWDALAWLGVMMYSIPACTLSGIVAIIFDIGRKGT